MANISILIPESPGRQIFHSLNENASGWSAALGLARQRELLGLLWRRLLLVAVLEVDRLGYQRDKSE